MRDRVRKEITIPPFLGKIDYDAYMNWEEEIELVFSYFRFSEEKKVKLAATAFSGHAIFWWDHMETTRRRQGQAPISSWFEMKNVLRKKFASSLYSRDVHRGLRRRSPGSKGDKKQNPIALPQQIPSVAIFGSKGVNNNLIHKVAVLHPSFIPKELDLRSNPCKGGEDGAILTSLQSRDVEDSIQQIQPGREADILPMNQAYQTNQEELGYDSTCSRNLTHEGITEKKNRLKSSSHEEDMQLTSRRTCKEPEREQRLVNEVFRSNQDEPSCESTCFGNLTHQRCTASWIHFKINYGLKVIQLLNQEMPGLPYLQAHGFNHLQTRLWRPGEALYTLQEVPRHHIRAGLEHGQAKKMHWAFGKAHESDGSEEESKAREAKPPDGLDKESHAYEAKWIYTSHTAQDEDAIKAHTFKAVQEKEAKGLWQGPVKSPPELKPIKRPFHIWCWTCTRKRGLVKAQEKAQFVGSGVGLIGFMF